MAAMANITVKKADGVTDITYTALAGSSGETVPAQWRQEDSGLPPALRPSAKCVAKAGANGRRLVEMLHVRPITRTVDGALVQVGVHTVRVVSTITVTDDQSNIDEAVMQGLNLAGATLIRTSSKEGYAPRG